MPREFDQHVRSLRTYVTKYYAKKQQQPSAVDATAEDATNGEVSGTVAPMELEKATVEIIQAVEVVQETPEAGAEEEV